MIHELGSKPGVVGVYVSRHLNFTTIEKASEKTLVREIMTSKVSYTSPDQKVEKSLSLMTKKRFRHMPVLEGGKIVGMLSIGDVRSKI